MPLNKVGPGNMYQDFITHTHSHLAGECPHKCSYCYVQDMARRFPSMSERYSGPPRLIEKEFEVKYGTGKTIFVENCSDLFADLIPGHWIGAILSHCRHSPDNTYVFQTKNPGRIETYLFLFPPHFMIGTTAESNLDQPDINDPDQTQAPPVFERLKAMFLLHCPPESKFVTIEPIQKFFLEDFLPMLLDAEVGTYYIGADSKNHGLPEPSGGEIWALICALRGSGKKVVLKSNLKRLYAG